MLSRPGQGRGGLSRWASASTLPRCNPYPVSGESLDIAERLENALVRFVGSKSAAPARFPRGATSVRQALLSSAALAIVAGVSLTSLPGPAEAAMPGRIIYPNGDPYLDPNLRPNPIVTPLPSA